MTRLFSRGLALVCAFAVTSAVLMPQGIGQGRSAPPPAGQVTPDPWPRTLTVGGAKYSLYQPQVDTWDGRRLAAHAAASVVAPAAKEVVFGVIEIAAKTSVSRATRTVEFEDITITKATFPSAPQDAARYQRDFQTVVASGRSTMSLDRLEAMLGITGAERKARTVPVKNDAPDIIFSSSAAVLVPIDGAPVWRSVPGTGLERVLNTRALMLWAPAAGRLYIHLFDGFVEAATFAGPWTVATGVPAEVGATAAALAKTGAVDLMEGPRDPKKLAASASLKNGAPRMIVATTPTELIVTDGAPDWVSTANSALVYVKNTTANVFMDLQDQRTYVLLGGRWFRGGYLRGPWEYVAGAALPPAFAQIPDAGPKENVLASVPGTPQAQEAVISNEIPQMATVDRAKARFTSEIDGEPDVKAIPDTPLDYVFNAPFPIIRVSPTEWYAVENGVWFAGTSAQGPWVVAGSVPPVIYSIPPSSPLHYVTYVQVYEATPQYVVVGYTPGYFGTVVVPDGVVVYGTGYAYASYIGAALWYPPPLTYGYGAAVAWTPWTGWAVGFGFGLAFGAAIAGTSHCCWGYCPAPYWGAMPYAHYGGVYRGAYGSAAAWGPGGWAATSGNVYHRWGATGAVTRTSGGYNAWTGNAWSNQVGHSYNSVTGRISAGQRGAVQNVYTGNYAYGQRGATYNPATGVSARGGSVTYGNAYIGQQNTVRGAQVTGPGGQSATVARSGNDYYGSRDGNVYRSTGSGWEQRGDGGWNSVQSSDQLADLGAQQQARQWGDQRSAGASWGSSGWGDGFTRSAGGDGWGGGGGGWDRGASGYGGGDRSWGGGGWGGRGLRR